MLSQSNAECVRPYLFVWLLFDEWTDQYEGRTHWQKEETLGIKRMFFRVFWWVGERIATLRDAFKCSSQPKRILIALFVWWLVRFLGWTRHRCKLFWFEYINVPLGSHVTRGLNIKSHWGRWRFICLLTWTETNLQPSPRCTEDVIKERDQRLQIALIAFQTN